jgi:hypothetical protein
MITTLLAIALAAQSPQLTKHYVAPKECAYEFDYPASWTAEPIPDEYNGRCIVLLRPNDFAKRMVDDDVDLFSLKVRLESAPFLVAAEELAFDFVDGKWVSLGRGGHGDVELMMNERWVGLMGYVGAGCYDNSLKVIASCEEPALIARGPGRDFDLVDRVWSMRGHVQSSDAFNAVVRSFRFVKQ